VRRDIARSRRPWARHGFGRGGAPRINRDDKQNGRHDMGAAAVGFD
jgi:hypothetical protein